jgi:hypothetical protein
VLLVLVGCLRDDMDIEVRPEREELRVEIRS